MYNIISLIAPENTILFRLLNYKSGVLLQLFSCWKINDELFMKKFNFTNCKSPTALYANYSWENKCACAKRLKAKLKKYQKRKRRYFTILRGPCFLKKNGPHSKQGEPVQRATFHIVLQVGVVLVQVLYLTISVMASVQFCTLMYFQQERFHFISTNDFANKVLFSLE